LATGGPRVRLDLDLDRNPVAVEGRREMADDTPT
jgi:hypothetical protein